MPEQNDEHRTIGENIRKYRLQKGLTQEVVAEGLCSTAQLSKMENGKSQVKPELLKSIANRLGVSVDQLQADDDGQQEVCEMLEMSLNALMTGHIDLSLKYAASARVKSREQGYLELYAKAVWYECQAFVRALRFSDVIECIQHVLFVEKIQLEPLEEIRFYLELGRAHTRVGAMDLAFSYFLHGEDLFQAVEEPDPANPKLMRINSALAQGHFEMRNYRASLRYIREAKRLAEINDRLVWGLYATNMEANALLFLGDREPAKKLYIQALDGLQKLTLIVHMATVQNNLGVLYMMDGQYGDAQVYFQRAFKNFELLENRYGQCECLLHLAETSLIEQEDANAERYLDQVATMHALQPVGHMYLVRMHQLRSRMYLAQDNFERGALELGHALAICEEHHVFIEAYETAAQLADLLFENGDARAIEYYRKAIEYDKRNGSLR